MYQMVFTTILWWQSWVDIHHFALNRFLFLFLFFDTNELTNLLIHRERNNQAAKATTGRKSKTKGGREESKNPKENQKPPRRTRYMKLSIRGRRSLQEMERPS
jgi:hypothetical protein